jgi:zinc/manganese transport system substrate-binding protein
MRRWLPLLLVSGSWLNAAELKVATLHPLLGDLARKVGGANVEVVDLIGPNGDPHHFEPTPADLQRAKGSALFLAAGLGLEADLPALKTIVPAPIIEVGASLPVLHGGCEHEEHDHHDHEEHAIDPHWWHSVDRFRRAALVVAEAFAAASPAHAEEFRQNAAAYRESLDALERWARVRLAAIPRDRRQLATAHAAFNYFCADFGFTPIPVAGLNREQSPDPAQLAALVAELKRLRVAAVFPEKESNPKLLQAITRDTGIRPGEPLIADGTAVSSYEKMVKYNVESIVRALGE